MQQVRLDPKLHSVFKPLAFETTVINVVIRIISKNINSVFNIYFLFNLYFLISLFTYFLVMNYCPFSVVGGRVGSASVIATSVTPTP